VPKKIFSTAQFISEGGTRHELAWGVDRRHVRIGHGWYREGPEPPTPFELQLGRQLSAEGMASGLVAAKIAEFDGVVVPEGVIPRRRRAPISPEPVLINGIWCTDGLQTLVDIAPLVDDLVFEQALESGLHKKYVKLTALEDALPALSTSRVSGTSRIKRVLALRPRGAPPTESLLETLFAQMVRRVPTLPTPQRQVVVNDEFGDFVARVDFAWAEHGRFTELDGQGHKGQPVYDAVRQTNVAIATEWVCGRFSWREVRWNPVPTERRLVRWFRPR
jgi:hypothetical protein